MSIFTIAQPVTVSSSGGGGVPATGDLDTGGAVVPTWMPHAFTYDGSGNVATDTVMGMSGTWVRTYTWTSGALSSDSGWVKQGG
jgi:hypothetical protein